MAPPFRVGEAALYGVTAVFSVLSNAGAAPPDAAALPRCCRSPKP